MNHHKIDYKSSDKEYEHLKKKTKQFKVAIFQTHPTQYHAPLYKALNQHPLVEVTVFYVNNVASGKEFFDIGFNRTIKWDRPLLDGYRSVFLNNLNPLASTRKPLGIFTSKTLYCLNNGHYDVVIIHGYSSLYVWQAMICARIVGIPIILYGEGTTLKRLGWRKRMIYQGIKNIILRLYFLNINAFLPVGNLCTAFYSNYGIRLSKMFRTPYCLDSVYFEERMKDDRPYRDRTRYELGINNDITAVFVAKLIPRKRPFDLLKAYVRMKYRDKMSLIFIGDGFLQKEMERFIEDKKLKKIHMVGFKNQSELSKYYMASDFAVLPSEYETWGLAVNEAMIHSLPVLTTNMVGSAYDLINPETGWRYPVGDIDKLSKILDNIIESPESCKSMGIAAKTLVSKYNIPACVDGIIRAIEYISKGRKK